MNWYLLFLLFAFCASYVFAYYFYPYFFTGRVKKLNRRAVASILSIAFLCVFIYLVSIALPGEQLGNRALHALGAVIATVICYMAVRDSGLQLSRFHFFVLTFLLVSTLGVGNEVTELILHEYTPLTFSTVLKDTWLDLLSNTVGALLAGSLLSALLPHKR